MKGLSRRRFLVAAGALAIVGIPLAGKWARHDAAPRCETDGIRINPGCRVRAVNVDGQSHLFCSPRCARQWIDRQQEPPMAVYVIDEVGQQEIDAESAFFVHSAVVTDAVTGNRIRAFRDQEAADAHVRAFGGWILERAEYPFQSNDEPMRQTGAQ